MFSVELSPPVGHVFEEENQQPEEALTTSLRTWLIGLTLIVSDILAFACAAYLARVITQPSIHDWALSGRFAAALFVTLLVVNWFTGLYPGIGIHPIVEMRKTSLATTLVFVILFAVRWIVKPDDPAIPLWLWISFGMSLFFAPAFRAVIREYCAKFQWWGEPILVFGSGEEGTQIYQALKAAPGMGLKPLGVLDDERPFNGTALEIPYLGQPQEAREIAEREGVEWAVVAKGDVPGSDVRKMIERHASFFPNLWVVPGTGGLPSLWNHAQDCGGFAGWQLKTRLLLPWPRRVKRLMDVALTAVGGLLILPAILLLAIVVRLSSPGPIFYSQERIGLRGRRFRAWKFRTMVQNADQVLEQHLAASPELRAEWDADHKLRKDPRVTRVGGFLRLTSLDELPQLWNVLCGEMSLVGPRPIVAAEVVKYAEHYSLYTKVLPGITGLWQVSGRNNTTYRQRINYDCYYVRNWSPWFDLYILACTIRTVVLREGAY